MSGDCCVQKSAMKVGKIVVDGKEIGISHLPSILEQADASGLEGDALSDELVRLAAIYNYIPAALRASYAPALMQAFVAFRSP